MCREVHPARPVHQLAATVTEEVAEAGCESNKVEEVVVTVWLGVCGEALLPVLAAAATGGSGEVHLAALRAAPSPRFLQSPSVVVVVAAARGGSGGVRLAQLRAAPSPQSLPFPPVKVVEAAARGGGVGPYLAMAAAALEDNDRRRRCCLCSLCAYK